MRGKLPDCSRGFSPAAAAQYIQRLQEVTAANKAFSKRNGELTQEIMNLREDRVLLSKHAQEFAKRLRRLREENLQLKTQVRDLTDEIDEIHIRKNWED